MVTEKQFVYVKKELNLEVYLCSAKPKVSSGHFHLTRLQDNLRTQYRLAHRFKQWDLKVLTGIRNYDKRFTAIINPLINIPGRSKSQGGQIDSDRLLKFPLSFLTSASHPAKPPGNLAAFKRDTYFTAHDSIALSHSVALLMDMN